MPAPPVVTPPIPVGSRKQSRSAVPAASLSQTTCPLSRYEPGVIPLTPGMWTNAPPVGTVPPQQPLPSQPSLGPVGPVGPVGPGGPVAPVAPRWFQFSGCSQLAQLPLSLSVSITRRAPVGFPWARLVL